jgi:hypothetical protein
MVAVIEVETGDGNGEVYTVAKVSVMTSAGGTYGLPVTTP